MAIGPYQSKPGNAGLEFAMQTARQFETLYYAICARAAEDYMVYQGIDPNTHTPISVNNLVAQQVLSNITGRHAFQETVEILDSYKDKDPKARELADKMYFIAEIGLNPKPAEEPKIPDYLHGYPPGSNSN